MDKALFMVIAAGLGIGLLIPTGRTDPPVPVQAAAEPRKSAARSESPTPRGWAIETRLQRDGSGHFFATAQVNGQEVEFLVDTGATAVALTMADALRIGIPVDPASFEVVGTGAGGPVRGQFVSLDRVSVDGKEVRGLRGAVLERLEMSLLGQDYLARIDGVEMRGDEMVLR